MENANMGNAGSGGKMIGFGIVAVLIVAGLGYFILGPQAGTTPEKVAVVESVATVNGVAITRPVFDAQLATAITTLKAQGSDTTSADALKAIKAQVLDGLVSQELVAQQMTKEGVTADPKDVESQYQGIMAQLGGVDKLKEQLATVNLTDEQLRANIALQLATQKYLLSHIDSASATASDKEVSDFYKEYSKDKKDVPTLKDLSAQIKQQIITNKQQLLVNAFIASLKEKATITTSPTL